MLTPPTEDAEELEPMPDLLALFGDETCLRQEMEDDLLHGE